jgi:A/G-specific adenine glycosylase
VSAAALLDWFRAHRRDLPWRVEPRDPYRVVVSEFMLQQTQVDRVAPRFVAFVERFGGFAALAAASEDEVLEMWAGLGYYRRARLLHRLAQAVVERGGVLPETASKLENLPGIGPYTAAAVASLAFGESVPVLDGNVLRVGSRVLASAVDPRSAAGRRSIEAWVKSLLAGAPAGEINEALMELGATVCSPASPSCGHCPLAPGCRARAEGRAEEYPPPRTRRATVELRWIAACVVDESGRWLLRRIDDGPILRGLWLPPLAEATADEDPIQTARGLLDGADLVDAIVGRSVRHSITHRNIEVVPALLASEGLEPPGDGWQWADARNPGVPTSSLLAKLVRAVDELLAEPDGHPGGKRDPRSSA